MRADLISPEYLKEQKLLHAAPRGYGGKGDKWAKTIKEITREFECVSALDYGCGQGTLAKALKDWMPVRQYDPAIEKHSTTPYPADLVNCTDVLEHIEPAKIDGVIHHLRHLTLKVAFVVIATRPASKFLSDGRNAHILLQDEDWWRAILTKHGFTISDHDYRMPGAKVARELVWLLT